MLRQLYAYWESRRRGRRFPARRDLDPLEFRYALGTVLLLDVLRDPLRFRFRLHGSVLAARAGYDMTGKMVDELPGPENQAVLLQRCHDLLADPCPLAIHSDRLVDQRVARYEVLWLPLSDDGEMVNMLMGALVYLDR